MALGVDSIASILLVLIGIAAVGFICGISIYHPRIAMLTWLLVLACIPSWFIVSIGIGWTPVALLSLLLLPAVILSGRAGGWRAGDWIILALVLASVFAVVRGTTPTVQLAQLLTRGILAYLVGRRLTVTVGHAWTTTALALILCACGVWAIGEYIFDWHPFVGLWAQSPEAFWSALQTRAGTVRSEAAFGHSIALGAALAIGLPFLLAARLPLSVKGLGASLLTLGAYAAGSRGPMLALLFGAILMIVFYYGRGYPLSHRRALLTITTLLTIPIYALFATRISNAGLEASKSGTYRSLLYEHLTADLRPFGLARFTHASLTQLYYRNFHSLDSTFVYWGVLFGWVSIAVILVGLAVMAWRTVRRRANVAEVALLAQLPVLLTVAPITQYYSLLWFIAGFAVSMAASTHDAELHESDRQEPAFVVSPKQIPQHVPAA